MSNPIGSVTLDETDYKTMQQALKLADELCTSAMSGQSSHTKALEFARVYNELKRRKIVANR